MLDLAANAAGGSGAVTFLPSGEQRSMAAVWRGAADVARWLRARVGRGGAVAALLSNTPDGPAVVLGVWRSGNTLVSLPHPGRGADPAAYLRQIGAMCAAAGAGLLLVDAVYQPLLADFPVPVATFQEAACGGPPVAVEDTGGLIQFTSGSLGRPKGVALSAEAVAANVLGIVAAGSPPVEREVACSWLPLSHDMGLIGILLTAIAGMVPSVGGERLVLLTPELFLRDPGAWLRACSDFGATITAAPNFAFDLACRAAAAQGPLDLSRMRVCVTGGERVRADSLRRFSAAFRDAGFAPLALCPAYGLAEATLTVTMVRPDEPWRALLLDREALTTGRLVVHGAAPDAAAVPDTDPDAGVLPYVANGRPIPGIDLRVVPGSAPEGGPDVGEVQVRGASLLDRYVGAPLDLTADGWLPTRDLGFLHDGDLFLVGRTDDSIIIAGRNHYATDIEAAVTHPTARAGCLAAVPLDDGYAIIAEPRQRDGVVPDAATLRRACQEVARLAVRAVGVGPELVAFVPRGRLAKTPSGKVQRRALADAVRRGRLDALADAAFTRPYAR